MSTNPTGQRKETCSDEELRNLLIVMNLGKFQSCPVATAGTFELHPKAPAVDT